MSVPSRRDLAAELGFCLALLALLATFFVVSSDYSAASRRSPWVVMVPLTGMVLWQLLAVLSRWRRAAGEAGGREPDGAAARAARRRKAGSLLVGVSALLGLVWLTGLVVGSGLFLAGFLRYFSGTRWPVAAALSVAVPGVMYLLFQVILGIQLYSGVLAASLSR